MLRNYATAQPPKIAKRDNMHEEVEEGGREEKRGELRLDVFSG